MEKHENFPQKQEYLASERTDNPAERYSTFKVRAINQSFSALSIDGNVLIPLEQTSSTTCHCLSQLEQMQLHEDKDEDDKWKNTSIKRYSIGTNMNTLSIDGNILFPLEGAPLLVMTRTNAASRRQRRRRRR